jgi:predicted membrane metal-binding protein
MTASRIDAAFDRIDAFLAVQSAGPTVEAVTLLQEAVGVDDNARARISDRIAALDGAGHPGAVGSVMLGIVVGLFAGGDDA